MSRSNRQQINDLIAIMNIYFDLKCRTEPEGNKTLVVGYQPKNSIGIIFIFGPKKTTCMVADALTGKQSDEVVLKTGEDFISALKEWKQISKAWKSHKKTKYQRIHKTNRIQAYSNLRKVAINFN
jgi:TATA-box binding protein (TBP) (component of TFIID and TFIIIB)